MDKLNKLTGITVLTVICIIPLFLWLSAVDVSALTSSSNRFVGSLGKAAALGGMALYAVSPILSMRHRFLEVLFGNLNNVYSLHKSTGKVSFYLIALHPVFLGAGRLMGGRALTDIWNWSSVLILSGIIALAVFAFVVAVSIYAHIKHQNWIWIHRLLGWLMPLFYFHAFVAGNQMANNKPLQIYMLTLGGIGLVAFFYRSVLGKFLLKRYRYAVAEVNHVSSSVAEIVLKPLGIPITYQPGQFAFLSFASQAVDGEAHPYSFANVNNGPYARFVVKALGDDTTKLQQLEVGAKAFLEGPYGNFSYTKVKNTKQVWIAGGIGITPFLSMARSFSGKQQYDIRFFYGTESLAEAVFLQEFIDMTRYLPDNFNTSVVAKNLSGFISIETLQKSLDNLNDFDYLICGPPVMMKSLTAQLIQAGVPENQIHSEMFSM